MGQVLVDIMDIKEPIVQGVGIHLATEQMMDLPILSIQIFQV